MKFIHLADAHLADKSSFNDDLGSLIRKKSWESFENIFKTNTDVDFALIAGDLFERQYFSAKDFDKIFDIFKSFGKDIYYVTGNHDYFDEYNTIFLNNKPNNLHIFTEENLSLFENGKLRVYGLSYKDRIYKNNFPYDLNLDRGFFNILLSHADISPSPTNYLDLDPVELNKIGFDYIALGHIHKASNIYNIFYPGSIEPHDFSDIYDYGYIRYDDGEISQIDSSLLSFENLDIYTNDFKSEDEIIDFIESKLSNKINFLRINIKNESDINFNRLKKKINASYVEINEDYDKDLFNLGDLYPNSLLSKYDKHFENADDEISKLARQIGLDAILRSKK
ncbi:exonuclease SbcCD subunit D [Anaerococcus sp. DFU013_CI05]|uniref:metallophosphoesterase family protein n=1 Tax=Anaerococcus sp. AH8042_DFU013_CI05 TaxID=3385202 RepID=UPI003A520EC0